MLGTPGAAVFCSIFCGAVSLDPGSIFLTQEYSTPYFGGKSGAWHISATNTMHTAHCTIDQKTKINTLSIDLQCASRWKMRSAVRRLLDPRRETTTPRIIWVLISQLELSRWLYLQNLLQHSRVISSWLVVSGSKYSQAMYSLFSRPMTCVLHRSPAKCFPSRSWLLICGSI